MDTIQLTPKQNAHVQNLDARMAELLEREPACALDLQIDATLAGELITLLDRFADGKMPEQESQRLAELLALYRGDLVQKAQAVTDWLEAADVAESWSAVTQLKTVRSTMLYAVGYDEAKRVLEVVFNSGGIYRYHDVPPQIYRDLLKSNSVGRFMWEHVLGQYPLVRIQRKRRRAA